MAFQLEVSIVMRHVDDQGRWTGANELRVQESATLGDLNFAEVAEVLGRFHELTESLKGKS